MQVITFLLQAEWLGLTLLIDFWLWVAYCYCEPFAINGSGSLQSKDASVLHIGWFMAALFPVPLVFRLPPRDSAEWVVCLALFQDLQAIKIALPGLIDPMTQQELDACANMRI